MSGVATLKLRGAKRVFDEMAVDLPVAPNACSPARFVIRPPPLKRGRYMPPSASTNLPTAHSAPALPPPRPSASPSKAPPLPSPQGSTCSASAISSPATAAAPAPAASSATAPQQRLSDDELAALARHVPRRLKRVVDRMATGHVATADKVFTVNDLRDIISSVLAEREAKLSEDFARILHERLAEQFRDFTKFNEDYVTRQLRGRDFAYLS